MFLCRRPLLHRLYTFQPRLTPGLPFPLNHAHFSSTFGLPNSHPNAYDSASSSLAEPKDVGTRTWAPVNTTLQEYISFRPKACHKVHTATLLRLLKEAVKSNNKLAVGYVATDILRLRADPERNRALRHLILDTEHRLIWPNTILAILNALAWGGQLDKFTDYHLKTLAHRITVERERTPFAGDFSVLLHSNIMRRLKLLHRVPVGARSVSYELPDIVEAAFELLSYLLLLKNESSILELFQALTEKLFIPPEAVQQAPTTSTDFYYIVSVTLSRACLYWYKRGLAHRLLLRYLPSGVDLTTAIRQKNASLNSLTPSPADEQSIEEPQQSLDPQLLDLITDTLYATLRNPNLSELELCVDVISRVHLLAPIQGGIIRLVYTAATECNSGNVARRLYAFTREPAIEKEHHYPGPQGRAILFLMAFLTQEKGNTHLARILANEVVENDTFLPVNDRPKFLTLVASQSFGKATRTLWERYAIGKDKASVVGHNALLTRIVRLFTRMARLIEADLPDHGEDASDTLQNEQLGDSSINIGWEVNHADSNHEASSNSQQRDSNSKPSVAELRERVKDIRLFVQRVIEAFVQVHAPLAHAKHANLSSLARAYFVMGDFAKGFEVFRNLIRRREVPDLHDINIGLSALAEHNPRSAAKMIEVMTQRGIQPNSVTFGTVIHQALVHGDMQLVGDLLQLARQAGNIQLSPQGLFSLTRASVILQDGSGTRKNAPLKDALELFKSLPDNGRLSSPDMGKFMVFAALREGEPVLAFEFWKLLLKYSSEWDDKEQIFVRRLLRRSIIQTLGSGMSRSNMLNQLWERPPYHAMK
ncbi:hypothetical protein C8J55DRAFT_503683 [Lentinula edodes]|uniref:Pentatricopeptide repeat-containing protein n=1 Tax=Lentinula lateritia TaxID=40482 RepID=A0A9W9AXD1_9AGAR|nr:hypothetical protein C8J55DRAFT_503683 [Lentinula edodes]